MTIKEAIKERHSVRSYTDRPIEKEKVDAINELINEYNHDGNLHIQLVRNDPKAFDSRLAHYGKFSGVGNYLAMIGPKSNDLDERLGYYGELLALKAQTMGLNTCWVGLTFKKNPEALQIADNEKLRCVIALGYGATQGVSHKVKTVEKVAKFSSNPPQWFLNGVKAALLAPTAMNQQKFTISLGADNHVSFQAGWGFFTKIDLGIAKCHFEIGAGKENYLSD